MLLRARNFGGYGGRRPHPPNCTCRQCNEEWLDRRGLRRRTRRAAEEGRRRDPDRAASADSVPAPPTPQQGDSGEPGRPPHPLVPPPAPPPDPSAGAVRGRPQGEEGSPRAAILWLLLVGAVVGAVIAVLYVTGTGPFSPSGDGEPVMAAAPPTKEAPTETPSRAPTTQPAPLTESAPTTDSSESNESAQVEESSGWFSIDCDSERRRRRGGWLREIVC